MKPIPKKRLIHTAVAIENYYKYMLTKQGYEEDFVDMAVKGEDAIVGYFADKYRIDLKNYKTYLDAKQDLDEQYSKSKTKWEELIADAKKRGDDAAVETLTKQMNRKLSTYENAMNDLAQFSSPEWLSLQSDLAAIKERTYNTLKGT